MVLRILQCVFSVYAVIAGYVIIKDYIKNKEKDMPRKDQITHYIIGFVVNFFDALGIGSFAPTVALYNLNL